MDAMVIIVIVLLLFVTLIYWKRIKKLEQELLYEKEQYRSVIGSAKDAIIIIDGHSKIIAWNKGATVIFGYQEDEAIGENLQIIIPEKYRQAHELGTKRFLETNIPKVIGKTVELQGLNKDGNEIPVELSLSSWEKNGQTFFSGIIRDITERKQAEAKINFMAFHDELTNLPNRRYFNEIIEKELNEAKMNRTMLCVLMMDVNDFKFVNDEHGHSFGDVLLKEVAERLNKASENKVFVARIGGDEYTMLMPSVNHVGETSEMAEKIMAEFKQPVRINEHVIFVSISIGIAIYPNDGQVVDLLLKNADDAMYLAKKEGKMAYRFYSKSNKTGL